MKPAPFRYYKAKSLADAVLRMAGEEDAAFLSGGQSLVPMLNLRLARPATLIDLNACGTLAGIAVHDTTLRIGALTRHHALATDARMAALNPLLCHVAGTIGYYPIRRRGTIGGSLAHADPAAQWPLMATLFDAPIEVEAVSGARKLAARDFFLSVFATAREPQELLTAVYFPVLAREEGWGHAQIARVAGDFAIASAAATLRLGPEGRVTAARLAIGAVADTPVAVDAAELIGAVPGSAMFAAFAEAATAALDIDDTAQAPAEDRRDLARAMLERALSDAFARCGGRPA